MQIDRRPAWVRGASWPRHSARVPSPPSPVPVPPLGPRLPRHSHHSYIHTPFTTPRARSCYAITSFGMETNRHWWWIVGGLMLLSVAVASADGEVWEESDHEVLIRSERGAKNRETCRYVRGAWTECDAKTNYRSRKLTLKKGDPASCETVKTIQKKCKKACRYEKSAWSECSPNGEMSRTDMLKANSDPTCDKSKRITKKCNKNKQVKSAKDKGRRNRQ